MSEFLYDVLRDGNGDPITITPDQMRAIWHAIFTWQRIYKIHKGQNPDLNNTANMSKSCLLGRMLLDGRRPLNDPPPVVNAAPAYHLVDPELCDKCGGLRSEIGRLVSWSIEQDHVPEDVRNWNEGRLRSEYRCIDPCHFPQKKEDK